MADKPEDVRTTDTGESRPLFVVGNHHRPHCDEPPMIDGDAQSRYHGYFENEYGEQTIFIYYHQTKTGTLLMGDAGWEEPTKVVDGQAQGLVLSRSEELWLRACWEAATGSDRSLK